MANWASVSRLGDPRSAGWQAQNLVPVNVDGQSWNVYKPAAAGFQGFLNELAATGYGLKSSGGFNYRNIAGSDRLSQHAFGTAIDINAATNPQLRGRLQTDLPANVGQMAAKYGLEWGGNWKSKPDPMHFEYTGGGDVPLTETVGASTGSAQAARAGPLAAPSTGFGPLPAGPEDDIMEAYQRPLPLEAGFGPQQFMEGVIGGTLRGDMRKAMFGRIAKLFI